MKYNRIYELKEKKHYWDFVNISLNKVEIGTLEEIIIKLEGLNDKKLLNVLKRALKRGKKYKKEKELEFLQRVIPNFNN